MKVICISGHARNGKDTTAELIQKTLWGYGYRVLITHYGDLLKYLCSSLFEWDGKKDERGRHLLQYIGTDVVRKRDPDFWVSFVVKVLDLFNDQWDYVIIPDTRFPNEIEVMKAAGHEVIHLRVTRPGFSSGLTEQQMQHSSETSLDGAEPDYTISNDGSYVDLTLKVLRFVQNYLKAGGGNWLYHGH